MLHRVLWLEPFWIGLLAPSLLFPGRFWVAAWQPALVVLLFVFWPLRTALRRVDVPRLFGLPVGVPAACRGLGDRRFSSSRPRPGRRPATSCLASPWRLP